MRARRLVRRRARLPRRAAALGRLRGREARERLEDPRATAGETLSRGRSDPISDPISSSDTKEATRCSVSVSVAGIESRAEPRRAGVRRARRLGGRRERRGGRRGAVGVRARGGAPTERAGFEIRRGRLRQRRDGRPFRLGLAVPEAAAAAAAGTKPPRAHRRGPVETRFARRARCDPADVIYSLASEGVWAEARKSEKRETNRAARKVAEKAPVEEKGGDASDSKNADRIQTEFKKKPGPGPPATSRRTCRFAASFVSAPPLVPAAEADARAAIAAEADAMVRLDDIPCAWCGDGSGESAFVLCDGCPNGGHLACLGLRGVPKNRWVCAVCADGARARARRARASSVDRRI